MTDQELVEHALRSLGAGTYRHRISRAEHQWSASLRELLGLSADYKPGPEGILEFVCVEDSGRVSQALLRGRRPDFAEPELLLSFRMQPRDSPRRWVELRVIYERLTTGEATIERGVLRDVTEQRHLEEELRFVQRSEAVARMAAGVAHDFNNLLTVVSGEVALIRMAGEPDAETTESLGEIDVAVERATTLTRQFLSYMRRRETRIEAVDGFELIRQVEPLLRRVVHESLDLRLNIEPGRAAIEVDCQQFEQVLLNLAVNADEAMPQGGRLDVRALVKSGAFVVEFSDDGVGVPSQLRERVFEPFFSSKESGRGLGLAACRSAVELFGGELSLEPSASGGALFQVRLPLRPFELITSATAGEEQDPEGLGAQGWTVLLAEDDPSLRRATSRALRAFGFEVIPCENGEEALEVCADSGTKIDLLLTDLVMPDGGGRELRARFRRQRPHTPVLVMSGYAPVGLLGDQDEAVIGQENFLAKPFAPRLLAKRVRELILGRES